MEHRRTPTVGFGWRLEWSDGLKLGRIFLSFTVTITIPGGRMSGRSPTRLSLPLTVPTPIPISLPAPRSPPFKVILVRILLVITIFFDRGPFRIPMTVVIGVGGG